MLIRRLCTTSFAVLSAVAAACGNGDDGDGGGGPGGVGAACDSDSDCAGYANAACVTELRPVADLVTADAGAAGELFRSLTIPFPGGYCSHTIDSSCATDADCGEGGGCYRPFDGVPEETIMNLNALVPFDLQVFADRGLCLKTCTSASDCRTDEQYACIVPLHAFVDVINPTYMRTFCIQDVDVSYLLQAPADAGM